MAGKKNVFVLLTGGCLSEVFLHKIWKEEKELENATIICADKGIQYVEALGRVPDYLIGDFDSSDKTAIEYWENYEKEHGVPEIIRLNPVKDETDTHAALKLAMEKKAEKIYIFGAMGGRQDHFLGNLNLLMLPMKAGTQACLLDEQNKIYLRKQGFSIQKKDCYGKYISFLPFTEQVTNVTMRGFRYETDGIVMTIGDSLGISNEVSEEAAEISWDEGIMIVVESRD